MTLDINVKNTQILLVNVYVTNNIWEVSTLEEYLYNLSLLEDIPEEINYD